VERVDTFRQRSQALEGVFRAVDAQREADRGRHGSHHDVAQDDGPPPCTGTRVDLQGAKHLDLGETSEPERRVALLDHAREVEVVSAPVARQEPHRWAELVGTGEDIEGAATTARDERSPELAHLEHAQENRTPLCAHGIECLAHHRVAGRGNATEAPRPAVHRAFSEHVTHDGDERERLRDEVIAPPGPRSETIHELVQRTLVGTHDPARVVGLGELGEGDGPGSGAFDAPSLRVQYLAETHAIVNDEEAPARASEPTLGRGAWRPQMEKSLPVLRSEALEAHVRSEHVCTIDEDASGLATMPAHGTRRLPMAVMTAESLFEAFFWPLYPADVKADLQRSRKTDANPGENPALFAHVEEAARVFERMAPQLFGDDDPRLDRSDASVHRLSRAVTRARREAWQSRGKAGTAESVLFNATVHGVAYVGACVTSAHGGRWSLRRPLWESVVTLESRAGRGDLAIFQWWLKSLSDESLDGLPGALTLADRYRAHVEIPSARPEDLPILATPRRVPRLAKVRYDTLYKHLRAHVPELRDVGEDFPSPERFAAYGFDALDFVLLGDGRMLLIHGPGKGGAHLFWLGSAGFEKAAFFPADPFPAPLVRTEGDKLVVLTQFDGKTAVHEMLWWGP
jgi:hypothetical protein